MKKIIFVIIYCLLAVTICGQVQDSTLNYRRSSLYSMLISHTGDKFGNEIRDVFLQIPVPDKFDNHDLSIKVIHSDVKKKEAKETIDAFLERNQVGRRMVSKWFERDPETGFCDMKLIRERGLYNATIFDAQRAKQSFLGSHLLADAGEELLNNTFVLINDIRYHDKHKTAQVFGTFIKIAGAVAGAALGNSDVSDLADKVGDLAASIKGFSVSVTSYLYRLEWNDDIAMRFYQEYYMDSTKIDETKRMAFNELKNFFKLSYVGSQQVSSGKTSIEGVNTESPEQMIRKVCTRAIDKSIVELQREHEEFRVKTPILSVEPAITAPIGLKEGVNEKNKYEVLEVYLDKNGKMAYKQVGIIQAVPGKIWDNRYMATEEHAYGADFNATTFRKISGGDFYRGMLIRELKIK